MAEFADMGDPTQLYTAIEKAYCEDRWPDVLEQGEKLLSQLPADDLGLRQRLQLLMAHTFLYGYGDRDSAEDLYRAVHDSKAESALRQIASQGLQQCDLPPERLPASTTTAAPASTPQEQGPVAASRPALDPDNLPRPVGAPALEEEDGPSLHDSVQALNPEPAVPWTAEPEPPAPAPQGSPVADTPVMPWLEAAAPAAWAAPAQPWSEAVAPETGQEPDAGPDADAGEAIGTAPEPGAGDEESAMPPLLTVDVTEPHGRPSLESLIPDVIDEPELVEVHQADPRLAEEFELQETAAADPAGPSSLAEPAPEPAEEGATPAPAGPALEEDPELLGGLLRVEIV